MKTKRDVKRPTKEKVIKALQTQLSDKQAEEVLDQMESLCWIIYNQIKDG